MVILMLAAFRSAGPAYFCTYFANGFRPVAAQAHQLGGSSTDNCTFHIQFNTRNHHLYVFFLQAGSRTMVAGSCAGQACIDTFFKIRITIRHILLLKSLRIVNVLFHPIMLPEVFLLRVGHFSPWFTLPSPSCGIKSFLRRIPGANNWHGFLSIYSRRFRRRWSWKGSESILQYLIWVMPA